MVFKATIRQIWVTELSTQYISEIIEPKACTHSPSGFRSWDYQLIGSLRNDDGDVNENGKKALNMFRINAKTTTLHVHSHVFLYISLP